MSEEASEAPFRHAIIVLQSFSGRGAVQSHRNVRAKGERAVSGFRGDSINHDNPDWGPEIAHRANDLHRICTERKQRVHTDMIRCRTWT